MNGSITWGLWRACAKRLVLRRGWMPKTANRQQASVGTATVAMILNGLGFSNRQLYLVPQYFANKPVEHLLGTGISADMLNDDCLGRTLDWLYAHDPTKLFAGIASRARQIFGIAARQVHVDTTSFSVSGAYSSAGEPVQEPGKAAMTAIQAQLREANAEPSIYVTDNGIYGEANMRQLNAAGVKWVSRISETSTEAKTVLQAGSQDWQRSEDGSTQWYRRVKN